ncbi:MAG: glycosyltransferase family 4 protein [Planctomycetes bacterium]|nr:glycosyltransferase family 4 protein [Planctomycetota bacterium]
MPVPHVAIAVLCGTTGGPATYGRRLVAALAQLGEARLSVLTDRPEHFDLAGVDAVPLPMKGGLDRLRWQHLAVPRALRRLRPDVYHDTKNALPRRLPCPAAVTVHDLAYHTVPDSFGFASRWFLKAATRDAVRRAAAVIVPSQATANDLRRIHARDATEVHVVPHGIDPADTVPADRLADARRRLSLPDDYVLHVGTVQARKNVDLVVAGVRQLRQRGLPHRALVIGRRGWLSERAFAEIDRDDTAVWIEHVDAADLHACYAGAAAFVSPSAYEGFGLAVADALAHGTPTVIADVSSLPELCGDAAIRLSSLSAAAVADALEPVLREPEQAREWSRRGRERAGQFGWRAAAEGHLRAYAAAMAAGR